MKCFYLLLFCILGTIACQINPSLEQTVLPKVEYKMRGLSFVAPPKTFEQNPMPAVQAVAADWLAIIPYAYTSKGGNRVRYNESHWQWWGERPEGVRASIRLAKEAQLKVMLKPQIYVPGSWTGDLSFSNEEDWQKWSISYKNYILPFVAMADSMQVELFCIGTEFKKTVQKREQFWRQLIQEIRQQYKGKLIYAANWDEYQKVPFWDALDYIGINAYFPLIDKKTPSLNNLKKSWKPYQKTLQDFALQSQRPIIFTEYGYLSVDGCAHNTWELEAKINSLNINEQAQANAIQAILDCFWDEPYWAGGFLWKWFPNNQGHEGYFQKDYTPQGKTAAEVLKKCYSQ